MKNAAPVRFHAARGASAFALAPALAAALVSMTPVAAVAAEDTAASPWRFRAQMYIWLPSIDGETVFPPPAGETSVGLDASDYLSALQFAFMGGFEARYERFAALADVIYLSFDANRERTRNLSLGGGQFTLPIDTNADVGVRLSGLALGLAGAYTLVTTPTYEIQALAGARLFGVETEIDWRFNGNVGALPPVSLNGKASTDPDVWDGVAGVRGRTQLGSDKWFATGHFDVGAGDSDLTWQLVGGVGHAFGWGEVVLSYRHLDYDFGEDKALREMTFSGPAIAFAFSW
jgi:hypothetical protein